MKSKILYLSSAVTLLLGLPGAQAWCSGESCLHSCLTFGNSHKTCLSVCCEMNSDNYLPIAECHNTCKQQCPSQVQTNPDHTCYSGCINQCAQSDKSRNGPSEQGSTPRPQNDKESLPVIPTVKDEQELAGVVDDKNEYASYLECENSCMFQSSVFKIEKCQKQCTLSNIQDTQSAYKQKWYALHQSTFNSESRCDNDCLAYHDNTVCCQPFNKKLVSLISRSQQSCDPVSSDCLNKYYNGQDLAEQSKVTDQYVAECQSHQNNEVRVRCYLKAQSLSQSITAISEISTSTEKKNENELEKIDQHLNKFYVKRETCEQRCNSDECKSQCSNQFSDDIKQLISTHKNGNDKEIKIEASNDDDIAVELETQDAFSLMSSNSIVSTYYSCLIKSVGRSQIQQCETNYKNAKGKLLANLAWHQDLYKTTMLPYSDTFSFNDKFAVQLEADEDQTETQCNGTTNVQTQVQSMEKQQIFIQQIMTTKALMSVEDMGEKIDQLIEDELSRRDELSSDKIVKQFNILKNEAKTQYIEDLKRQWLTSLDLSQVNQPFCRVSCASNCFRSVSYNPHINAYDCVTLNCGCQLLDSEDYMQIEDLLPPINSFPEYEMQEINERTIMESGRISSSNNRCNFHCGNQCLSLDLQFAAKEACLIEACECTFNFFYQDPSECSMTCGNKCQYLNTTDQSASCVSQCGCDEYFTNKESFIAKQYALFSTASQEQQPQIRVKMTNLRKTVFIAMFIIMMWATVFTVVKIKRESKDMMTGFIERPLKQDKKKKRVIRDQVYEKMSNRDNQEETQDTFEFEGTYEKVI